MTTALATPDRPPYADGETRSLPAGQVTVSVQRITANAYRVSVRYASTGFEIGELSKSHPTVQAAREHATNALVMFRGGITVTEAIEMQEAQA